MDCLSMKSQAKTVAAWLDALPDDRRAALKTFRAFDPKDRPAGIGRAGVRDAHLHSRRGFMLVRFAEELPGALYLCGRRGRGASCGAAQTELRKRVHPISQ